ncbi:hypothetical protein GQ600_5880 [Phytophthora cactorum]|nr:hypothetical protein GQ600_5880 [Phytophthora cactorum]
MVTAALSAKKGTPSSRGATVPAPILLSPISVAHRSQMMEAEAGIPSTGNAVRDQWVANLQKKRMAAAAGTGDPIGNGNPLPPGSTSSSNSSQNRAQLNAAALEKSLNSHQRNMYQHSQFASMSSDLIVDSQIAMSEVEAQAFGQPSMLFSGLDCFELESPSFSRLISSSLDGDFPLASSGPTVTTKKTKSRPKRARPAKATHTASQAQLWVSYFDDFDLDYSVSSGFPGVGTPSNFRVDASTRHLWGQELDLTGAGGYADTFLDLPTPRLAEMPLMPSSQQSNASTASNNSKHIEQEGLSYFLEQTNLDGNDGGHGEQLYSLQRLRLLALGSRRSRVDPSSLERNAAVCGGCGSCGRVLWRQVFYVLFDVANAVASPLGSQYRPGARRRMTPRDPKHPPEFETLTDEYKLTDIDHELDSFYLDTMEAIGNDLDLMSN